MSFLRRFFQIASSFHAFGFYNNNFFYKVRSSALRPTPQPGELGPCIYVPQWQGGPVITPGTGFPIRPLQRLAGYGGSILTCFDTGTLKYQKTIKSILSKSVIYRYRE
jgi:hypothetical protein